jgi:hypothetical protein
MLAASVWLLPAAGDDAIAELVRNAVERGRLVGQGSSSSF